MFCGLRRSVEPALPRGLAIAREQVRSRVICFTP